MAINAGTAIAYLDLDITAFNQNLSQAQSALQTFADSDATMSQKLTAAGGAIANTGSTLTRSITVPLLSAGQSALQFGMDFDKQMSNVQSVSNATSQELQMMRDAAIDWGEKTVYTATEAGDALYYMGLAGWDVNESVAGLPSVLNLAAAGQLDLGRASDIVTDSMTGLHLQAGTYIGDTEATTWYTNLLAAAMSNSNTTVDLMGESFKYVSAVIGGIENPMYSAEQAATDATFALGLLADSGIKSSQAGTTLRRILLNLENPSTKVAEGLEALGFEAGELDITTLGLKGTLDLLRESVRTQLPYLDEQQVAHLQLTEGLSEEQAQMELYNKMQELVEDGTISLTQQETLAAIAKVGGAYAVAGLTTMLTREQDEYDSLYDTLQNANSMYVQHEGKVYTAKEAYELFGDAIYTSGDSFEWLGAAEGMASVQMDNLWGDITKLTSALGTTKIELTEIVQGALREFVQKLTELVVKFNDLDPKMQENILKYGMIAAAIGPALVVIGTLISSVGKLIGVFEAFAPVVKPLFTAFAQLRSETSILHGVLGMLKSGIGALNLPMLGIIAVIALVVAAIVDLWKNNEEFRDNVKKIWDAIVDLFKSVWDALKPIFDTLVETFKLLVKAIEPIIEIIVALLVPAIEMVVAILKPVIKILSDVIRFVLEIVNSILKFLIPIIQDVADFICKLGGTIMDFIKFIGDAVADFFSFISGVVETAVDVISGLWDKLCSFMVSLWDNTVGKVIQWVKDLVDGIVGWFKNLWNELFGDPIVVDICNGLTKWFSEALEAVFGFVKDCVKNVVDKFKELASNLKEKVSGIVKNTKEKFSEMASNIKDSVAKAKEHVADFANKAKEKFAEAGNNIKNFFTETRDKFSDWREKWTEKTKEFSEKFVSKLKEKTDEAFTNFGSFFGDLLNLGDSKMSDFLSLGANLMNSLGEGLKKAWEGISNWIGNAFDGVKGMVDSIKSKASSVSNTVFGWINGSHANGLSYVPFDGYIAELHKGERVLTADENRKYSGGSGDGTTINFYSNERIDEYVAARELKRTMHDIELGLV